MTRGLPAGLAEPLHILEPWPWRSTLATAVLVTLALLLLRWLWHWWRRRPPAPTGERLVVPLRRRSVFGEAVEAILHRARESRDFRSACHELALLLRSAWESQRGDRIRYLTAQEIADRFGENRRARLLLTLAELRFGRRTPDENDLEGLCELALEAYGRGGDRTR